MTKKKSETKKDTKTNEEKNILIEESVKEKDADKNSNSEEAGIFDEDLNDIDETVDDVSDFSIGNTILSSAPLAHGQHGRRGHNLEELAERKKTEDSKWNDSGEFDKKENLGRDFYGTTQKVNDLYKNGNNNQDLYNERNGDLYSGENNKTDVYDVKKSNIKNYGALVDNRHSGRSMLEVAGFEDKEKQKQRNMRGLVKYEGKEE